MSTGLYAVVVAPPAAPPRGATLLRSAHLPPTDGDRWLQGLTWRTLPCGSQTGMVRTVATCTALDPAWPTDSVPATPQYVPPFVAVGMACSAISGESLLAETAQMARDLLDRAATIGVARELWRGDAAIEATPDLPNQYLAESTGLNQLNSGTAYGASRGFAELEMALAGCSFAGAGMIHASARTVTLWKHLQLVERLPDGRIMSVLGTTVVADPGYDGSAPDGTVDATGNTAWAYATGMVDVRLGPVQVLGADQFTGLHRTNNDFSVYAAQPFAATFDPCCRIGAKIDHTTLT